MDTYNSVVSVCQEREDISSTEMGYKHGKTAADRKLSSFMENCCNIIQSNEDQNAVALMRSDGNHLVPLEKLANWIKKCADPNKVKISRSICQEVIYRSPEDSQQMVIARYGIWLQMENINALHKGVSMSQMKIWDNCVALPQMLTSGAGCYLEVFINMVDFGGEAPDAINVMVRVKPFISVERVGMGWPPTDFNFWDIPFETESYLDNSVLHPFVFNYYEDNALNPKQWLHLDTIRKFGAYLTPNEPGNDLIQNFKVKPAGVKSIFPDPPMDQRKLNISRKPIKNLSSSNFKSELIPNILNQVYMISRMPSLFYNGAKRKECQDQTTTRKTKEYGPSATTGIGGVSVLGFLCLSLMLPSQALACSVAGSRWVTLNISTDSNNRKHCDLKILDMPNICFCGDCDQNQGQNLINFNETDLGKFCESQLKCIEANQLYLQQRLDLTLATLVLCLWWCLDKDFNVTKADFRYTLNGEPLSPEVITTLPCDFSAGGGNHFSLSQNEFMKAMKNYVKEIWSRFREPILHLLENDPSETTTYNLPSETPTSNFVVPLVIFAVLLLATIGLCYIFSGEKVKAAIRQMSKFKGPIWYRRARQAEAEGDPSPEDQVVIAV